MTQAEKMAEEYLGDYEWPSAPHNLAALIHQIAERTREEACLGLEKYLDIKLYPTESMKLQKAIHKARWEDEEDKP